MRSGSLTTTAVIGIGSTVLTDGAAPLMIVDAIRKKERLPDRVVLKTLSAGGFDLLTELEGFARAIIIAVFPRGTGEPGTVIETTIDRGSTERGVVSALPGDHGIEVSAVLALGKQCGYALPDEVVIMGIVASNVYQIGEQVTPEIAGAVKKVTNRVDELVAAWHTRALSEIR